ncbi:alpha/beta hydrolase [uncultured Azohydromonas sp.]|uniref:alpha/beta hydrolase n=1 Tax=uncultured Azohydromonas sp. TaxID=487342 RepID=UPI00262B85C9|nr:alpha/beta hydrolase [uncultured Azohydromonas sp.]
MARVATPPPARRHRLVARAVVLLLALAALALLLRSVVFLVVEAAAFDTPPPGTQRPDALGVPSKQLTFLSGGRRLHASWVDAADARAPALLVFHGNDEELSQWAAVQARLHAAGIASFVFDYSGYGASDGRPTLARLRQDGLAAWRQFVALTPQASRRVVLGFSLGSAVLLDVAPQLQPRPQGLVIGAGFASAREMAVNVGLVPDWAAWLLPDLWNNEERIGEVTQPLLILHGRNDELIPVQDALRLCRAAPGPRRLVLLERLPHDAPLEPARSAAFWDEVEGWVKGQTTTTASATGACIPAASP